MEFFIGVIFGAVAWHFRQNIIDFAKLVWSKTPFGAPKE
jgi:hypothetical protein